MRKPRNLSGVFFRYQNRETGAIEQWCIEDLPQEARDVVLKNLSAEVLRGIVNHLADAIKGFSDAMDAVRSSDLADVVKSLGAIGDAMDAVGTEKE